MGELTAREQRWLDAWEARCDADPELRRHDGYIEIFEGILAHRLGRARLEGARVAIDDAADRLSLWTEGPDRVGTARFSECCRDTYSLAVEEMAAVLRNRVDLYRDATHPAETLPTEEGR